jgi:Asp-tRNA(Asn)/Glu-tRNA(Gln) amidotransferase A subunit family amidase
VTEPLGACEAAAALRAREVSASELLDCALARLEETEPRINAFTVVLADDARAQAASVDAAFARGEDPGPLAGIPMSIKDHIWMTGAVATNGSRAYESFVPPEDCAAVRRIRESGAVIVGKTNNPEFVYAGYTDNALFGPTRNPVDPELTAGGSSGGAAASVAVGVTPLSIGTDSGGSIRIPAAYCGTFGLKPTFGLVPKDPGFMGAKTLSVNGPITRTARDAALMLSVIAGPDPADDMTYPSPDTGYAAAVRTADLSGLRVAWSVDCGWARVEPALRAAFEEAVRAFAATGATLVEAHPAAGDPTDLWTTIGTAEGFASEGPLLAEWESQLTPGLPDIIRSGDIPAATFIEALHERGRYARAWEEFFGEFDLLLTPTMQVPPFPIGTEGPTHIDGAPCEPPWGDWCNLLYPPNLTGQPAASVPCGLDPNGLPVGLQIIGPRFADARVLGAAAVFEAVRGGLPRSRA